MVAIGRKISLCGGLGRETMGKGAREQSLGLHWSPWVCGRCLENLVGGLLIVSCSESFWIVWIIIIFLKSSLLLSVLPPFYGKSPHI